MTDHQGLTDEQLATLRKLPCDSLPTTEVSRLFDLGVATGVAHVPGKGQPPGVYWRARRTETGDALLATLDHHTQQARADERRRIDDVLAMFTNERGWVTFATHDPEFPNDDPRGPYGFGKVNTRYEEFDSMGEGASPLEALEAATSNQEGTDQ